MTGRSATRRKRPPRAQSVGTLDVHPMGQIDVLSVGHGHLKLTITEGNAVEVEKARRIIGDMLERGFAIFIEQEDGTSKRVKRFDPKAMTYIIDDTMDTVPAAQAEPRTRKGKPPTKAVSVSRSKAVAVGRSAGG